MTYCKYCDKEVKGQRDFSWLALLGWFILTIPLAGFVGVFGYLLYWALIKSDSCPICKMEL